MPINLQPNQSIIIGKQGNQLIKITDPTVSRRHCMLTCVGNGDFILEDIGSSNGTFVNGLPVTSTNKARVKLSSTLTMGNFKTTVGELLGIKVAPGPPVPGPFLQKSEVTVHIAHLQQIYEQYRAELDNITKRRARMQIKRMFPMAFMGLIPGLTGFLTEDLNWVKGVATAACLGVSMCILMMMPSQSDNLVDEQSDLNKDFQIKYSCPHCKNFLGMAKPYEVILNVGHCPYCKSKFIH